MKKLDSYILGEFAGPFIFGLGVFFTLIVGVDLLYDAMRLTMRHNMPLLLVLRVLSYRLPRVLGFTLPMATIFASLMAFASLSGSGELVAIRVGGASLRRIGLSVLIFAALVSLVFSWLSQSWIPGCDGQSRRLLAEYTAKSKTLRGLLLRIPQTGPLQRLVYIDLLDPSRGVMEWVVIHEFKDNRPWVTLVAREARWKGRYWVLRDVEHTQITPQGILSQRLEEMKYDLGRAPEDLERIEYDTNELSAPDLRREIEIATSGPAADPLRAAELRVEAAQRWAMPWSVLGMALLGVALGVRPQRTSRSVALGLSLAVVLLYYVVLHTLTIVGQQGRLPAVVCAWTPNVALYAVGLVGLFTQDR
ncbi:MAG: LptF/LptG family permease [Armatimonadetes bacterium]|nr:LptF/LptG family permease [Armatimonadota bacterium]